MKDDHANHTGDDNCPICEQHHQERLKLYMKSGLSVDEAHLVDDLARHAVDSAIESIDRVMKTAPLHLAEHVYWSAVQMVFVNFGRAIAMAKEELKAKEQGAQG